MKITVKGSGGFAGLVRRHEVDTQACAAGPALEAAVRDSGFFAAPAAEESVGADFMRWTIDIADQGRQHSISFPEDGGPAQQRWQPLLDRILSA
ncbi:protealysin inhibitor emfourin [Massilia endophytica]|uniref:protealysin inhibitor emfourin n=1 Tax=Massilia endophytica TaxID=2899220 RepID=UPI001E62DCFE|nr:protealysin inhibitor emfourin [Massilia endophytica]UGQ47326.1 ATP-binding protein [Massilia endophytica]